MSLPTFHTADDVAAIFDVGRDTVLDWAQQARRGGRSFGVKIGRQWRFTDADVAAFVEASRERTQPSTTASGRVARRRRAA